MTNLLQLKNSKYEEIPFSLVDPAKLKDQYIRSIEIARENVAKIKAVKEPTFENVIDALEFSDDDLAIVGSAFWNLFSAHSTDELREIAGEISSLSSAYSNEVLLDPVVFEKIQAVYDMKEELNLSTEQAKVLDNLYTQFRKNGALLSDEDKETLKKMDEELAKLSVQFADNLLKATNSYTLHITELEQIPGLPESVLEAAQEEAKAKDKEGYVFTLDAPSFRPFLKFCENRALREEIFKAYTSRSYQCENCNKDLVITISKLRHKRAVLLGFNSHADYVLTERMAESPEQVYNLLNQIKDKALPVWEGEKTRLAELASEDQIEEIMGWDVPYYMDKLRKKEFNFDTEKLRDFFQLENVIDGVFKLSNALYDLEFEKVEDIDMYHEDVITYRVKDTKDDSFIGLISMDYFPRESKRGGAWMTNYVEQGYLKGKLRRPHVGIVCNFTKPTSTKPALLNYQEVQTLFHEFGHALHGLLSQCHYRSVSGPNVYWDFVELPSQILENWVAEKECLDLFAKHYETGEKIPQEYIEKIKATQTFMSGYGNLRQLSFAILDFAWHHGDPGEVSCLEDFERKAIDDVRTVPHLAGSSTSTAFSHLFNGGYSAGYYSYKWAEVLDADAFELFKQNGLFDKKTAQLFRSNILERGGTEHPMVLYKRFRGQEPTVDALLKREGLA